MNDTQHLELAHEFIDSFYSFDEDRLKSILAHAEGSQPYILYYQKWARCGNYEVLKQHEFVQNEEGTLLCSITVTDDLMSALGIDFNVTDTFHIIIKDGQIRSVDTSSDDPDIYYEAKEWVAQYRSEYVKKSCIGIWDGGPTPCECIKGMLKGFVEFRENQEVSNS